MKTLFEIEGLVVTNALANRLREFAGVSIEEEKKTLILCERADSAEFVEITLGLEDIDYVAIREGGLFFAPNVYNRLTNETIYFTVENDRVEGLTTGGCNLSTQEVVRYVNHYLVRNAGNNEHETRTFFRVPTEHNWIKYVGDTSKIIEVIRINEDVEEIVLTDEETKVLLRNNLTSVGVDFLEVQYGNGISAPRVNRADDKCDFWTLANEGNIQLLHKVGDSCNTGKPKFYLEEELKNLFNY